MPAIRRSKRIVKPYSPYGGRTLYIYGHGELRGNVHDISFMVPHGASIFIPCGPGVALLDETGQALQDKKGSPVNLDLAWIDRPGSPAHTPDGESERQHKLTYPMVCPNYTLLPPGNLGSQANKPDTFETNTPITLYDIVKRHIDRYDLFVWANCTVVRNTLGKPIGGIMDDLGDL